MPASSTPHPRGSDIIGDVHGHAEKLHALLDLLGYRPAGGAWQHPEGRTAVFIGDLINRGPSIAEVLRTVSAMMQAGSARCVMGNHEFNALQFHLRDDRGRPLREPTAKELNTHEATLAQIVRPSPDEWRAHLQWLRRLPLWLEEDGFRAVHACWDEPAQKLIGTAQPDAGLIAEAASPGALRDAVERLVRGINFPLPPDESGTGQAARLRLRWWKPLTAGTPWADASLDPVPALLSGPLPESARSAGYPPDAPPLFIGHYSQKGPPPMAPLAPNLACLDYNAGRGGPLAAYRWDGGAVLSADRFLSVA